jgi:hypothetical protein
VSPRGAKNISYPQLLQLPQTVHVLPVMLSAIFLTNLLRICRSSLFKDSRSLGVEIVRIHGSDRLGLGMKILQSTGAEWDQLSHKTRKKQRVNKDPLSYRQGRSSMCWAIAGLEHDMDGGTCSCRQMHSHALCDHFRFAFCTGWARRKNRGL